MCQGHSLRAERCLVTTPGSSSVNTLQKHK